MFESGAYAWWEADTVEAIRAANVWLDDYLDAHGPYDIVMGFSQGCLFIASYLMHRQKDMAAARLDVPPPFKGVVFICGGLSFRSLESLGVDVPAEALDIERRSVSVLHSKTARFKNYADNPDQIQRGVGLWDDVSDLVHSVNAPLPADDNVFGMNYATGFPKELLITLPVVNVFGIRDPRYTSAIQLAYTCRNRAMYDHKGGHDIPRTTEVSVNIAELIKQLARDIGL